ncbi:DUF4197 domain-containing protein [Mariniphaga sediminis]|uniref:DUF4197 domain-containing protein n=1 Tax=Mariniphaga sediminis TaxID=1628158 RepID=A0A399D1P9_9BACT|nr:DUF4197 domain-containing protein [Mariniphaga sediminis]RIH65386.1 DUF4197 domain-containing protein [Mariniphaga sediminis]
MKKLVPVLFILFIFSSCAELVQIAQQTLDEERPLTQSEIAGGLKEALIVGTGKSVDILGITDGYYKDEMVKILLPPEAEIITKNIGKVPGGEKLLEDVLLRINRAAENAASEAKPIFVNSIRSMTISDAVGILKGENNEATQYLHRTAYNNLFDLYRPKIQASLDKKLVGNVSTSQSWNTLVGKWNELAGSVLGQVAGLKPVDVSLDEYLTGKALDGLFLKIEAEEQKIRENPAARVTGLLKRVFGSVDV